MVTLVDDILRTEPVPCLLLKLLQDIRAYTGTVTEPVYELFLCILVEYQGKLVKKGSKTHDIRIRVFHHPVFQPVNDVLLRLRLSHVKCNLVLHIFPAVGNKIIHMYRVPDDEGQEADRIIVETLRLCHNNLSGRLVVTPLIRRHYLSGRAVNHLPPAFDVIDGIGL